MEGFMFRWMRSLLLTATLGLVCAVSAGAADTGTISGVVLDASGGAVEGATVTVSGAALPSGRAVVSDANGMYRIAYLPPGEYAIEVSGVGTGTAKRTAAVHVGRDTQVDVILGVSVTESVTVTALTPVVDVRSTEVSFNFQAETIASLPVERTYRGLLQLIPGVADNRSSIGPAAGGTRQENTYLIDGANITNPTFGYLGTDVNQIDIVEVNFKRAGITAEFGRAGGTVTNAVSRSGTNVVSGLARLDWLPRGLVGGYTLPDDLLAAGVRPGTFRDPVLTTTMAPAVGLGGPLIRDHVFLYGSARYFRDTKWDRLNKVGTVLPDEVRTGRELFGKLTAASHVSHQLTAGYRWRPNDIDNAGLNSDSAPSAAQASHNGSGIATAEWAHFLSRARSLNVRYLYTREDNTDVPVTDLGFLPPFDPSRPAAMGQYVDPAQANLTVGGYQYSSTQNYRRHEVRGTLTQFMNLGFSSHALKVGAGYEASEEELNRTGNGWGIIAAITQGGVPALRTRYFAPQPPQLGQGRTYSVFVQDEITAGRRFAVNGGVLFNRDEFAQNVPGSGGCLPPVLPRGGAAIYESHGDTCRFLRFGFGDEIQPRVGVTYQLRDGKGDKAYANWGRYFNMDQKSSGRSLAPARIFQTQTVFDLQGQVLSNGPLASTTGKGIDPDLAPIYSDEILVGYATPLAEVYSLDVFFMSRTMHNFIEDVPSRLNGTAPDSGPFVATNLPCAKFAACQSALARRTYRAATIDLRRQLARRWMADVSYTWSRFEGNYDLDYSTTSVFNTSSFIQDGPGTNVEEPNRFGPLLEDRPHVVKLFTSYGIGDRLTASGYLRMQSGTPWTARWRDVPGAMMNYLEPAGSHRNPTWTNLDLMAAYRVPLDTAARLSVEVRLLNAIDNQTRLSTDSQQYLDLRTMPTPPYIAPYMQPNPFFGAGNAFAPPRRLYLAMVASF
jgi:hypothetical protein